MPQADPEDIADCKRRIRHEAHAHRDAQENKDALSRSIWTTLVELPEYVTAGTVLFYLGARAEVCTRELVMTALEKEKRVVIPYCLDDRLELFHLKNMEELALGAFDILEPKPELRTTADRLVKPAEIDLAIVPGVAFDRDGGRLGHGLGYYDKLLPELRPDVPLVALAFECQVFPGVPVDAHDVRMDKIITERAVYSGRGRRG